MNTHEIKNRMFKRIFKLTKGKLCSFEQAWIFEAAYREYVDNNQYYKTKIQAINKIVEKTIEVESYMKPIFHFDMRIERREELSKEFVKLYHNYIELDYRGQ